MTDYYFTSSSYDVLAVMLTSTQGGRFHVAYENVLGPLQGRAAIPESADSEGNVVAGQEAAGTPGLWYVGIRSDARIELPADVSTCAREEAQAVLGQWV